MATHSSKVATNCARVLYIALLLLRFAKRLMQTAQCLLRTAKPLLQLAFCLLTRKINFMPFFGKKSKNTQLSMVFAAYMQHNTQHLIATLLL